MVSVGDILKLDVFKEFRLIAGEEGLSNPVIRGGIIDYESCEQLKSEDIRQEMLLSNLPMIKDKPECIVEYIEALIYSGTACFAIKTSLFKEIPQDAIDLANQHKYPLFLFDDLQLDKLVIAIDKYVNDAQQLAYKLNLIEQIQLNRDKGNEVKGYTADLNRYFLANMMVYQLKEKTPQKHSFDILLAQKILGHTALVLPLKESYLVIYTSQEPLMERDRLIHALGINLDYFYIGVSSVSQDHSSLGYLIYESQMALDYSLYKERAISKFDQMGIYQLLMPMLDNPMTCNFYKDIIETIKIYDEGHKSELLDTAIAYIQSDGQIKKTAELLFQHENTIRFRIRKLKELVEYESNMGAKYETLAMAIHMYGLSQYKQTNK